MHTTNYYNTFIAVSEDCPVAFAESPPKKIKKTGATIEFDMLKNCPYQYTSDEVLFQVYVVKNNISAANWADEKQKFFSKGQACFRTSSLTKRYGWGVHYNAEGKMAIYAMESEDYKQFVQDKNLKILKAMRLQK